MKKRSLFLLFISAFFTICNSHLFNSPDNRYKPEMSIISELPNALESYLKYINEEIISNLEENPDSVLYNPINLLRDQDNLQYIMYTFMNKVKYLKEDIVNKVVKEAIEVADANKEVLTDLDKIFKDITKKVKNGAQIDNIVEVTNDVVIYTDITLSNSYNKDPSYKQEADNIYNKVKDKISQVILRDNVNGKEDLRRYLNDINQQINFLESEVKVIVHKAKEIREVMVEVIKLKPILDKQFNNTKIN